LAFALCLSLPAALSLTACGGADEDFDDFGSDSANFGVANDFDESQLPDDFPMNLIPPDYASGNFMALGAVATASFESATPVGDTVAHYTALLGEPRLDNMSADGERTAQWDVSPWMLSVIGSARESIVGVTKTGN
jgi:hypothetical protein